LPKALNDITIMDEDTVAVAATSFFSDIYLINIKTLTLTKTITVSTTLHGLQYVESECIAVYNGTLTWLSAEELGLLNVGLEYVNCFLSSFV
jgi:hypothetical protein